MNNFEKFKNKEIAVTESSKVMGGLDPFYCITSLSFCVQSVFNDRVSNCAPITDPYAYEFCVFDACTVAFDICPGEPLPHT